MATNDLTAARLRELLDYNPDTGVFTWLVRRGCALAGSIAGNTNQNGRVNIYVDNREHKAHRLAWLYVYGFYPEQFIDHINGIPNDNRIENLRLVTNAENMQNQRNPRADNSSGFLGVKKNARGSKWRASIKTNGVNFFIGNFDTPELAHQAYIEAKRALRSTCTI